MHTGAAAGDHPLAVVHSRCRADDGCVEVNPGAHEYVATVPGDNIPLIGIPVTGEPLRVYVMEPTDTSLLSTMHSVEPHTGATPDHSPSASHVLVMLPKMYVSFARHSYVATDLYANASSTGIVDVKTGACVFCPGPKTGHVIAEHDGAAAPANTHPDSVHCSTGSCAVLVYPSAHVHAYDAPYVDGPPLCPAEMGVGVPTEPSIAGNGPQSKLSGSSGDKTTALVDTASRPELQANSSGRLDDPELDPPDCWILHDSAALGRSDDG